MGSWGDITEHCFNNSDLEVLVIYLTLTWFYYQHNSSKICLEEGENWIKSNWLCWDDKRAGERRPPNELISFFAI